jgi:hypothetical protein
VSGQIGITEEQLSDLSRFENSAHFSDKEKLVLHLAVSLTRTPSDVCDEFYGELRKRFSERELVELDAAIWSQKDRSPSSQPSPSLSPQQSNNIVHDSQCLSRILGVRRTQFEPGLCL